MHNILRRKRELFKKRYKERVDEEPLELGQTNGDAAHTVRVP